MRVSMPRGAKPHLPGECQHQAWVKVEAAQEWGQDLQPGSGWLWAAWALPDSFLAAASICQGDQEYQGGGTVDLPFGYANQ